MPALIKLTTFRAMAGKQYRRESLREEMVGGRTARLSLLPEFLQGEKRRLDARASALD
jgi:hypothetical protein